MRRGEDESKYASMCAFCLENEKPTTLRQSASISLGWSTADESKNVVHKWNECRERHGFSMLRQWFALHGSNWSLLLLITVLVNPYHIEHKGNTYCSFRKRVSVLHWAFAKHFGHPRAGAVSKRRWIEVALILVVFVLIVAVVGSVTAVILTKNTTTSPAVTGTVETSSSCKEMSLLYVVHCCWGQRSMIWESI